MVRARSALAPLTALAALLSLASCSSPEPAPSDDQTSPLASYLQAIYGGTDVDDEKQQERFAEDEKKRQSLIAECMTEQGFEYRPTLSAPALATSTGDEWKPDDREWVAQWGYGIAQFPGADEPLPQDTTVDPNEDYLASLPESEQNAYWEALYGATADDDRLSDGDVPEYDWTTAGCAGRAGHEVSGDDPLQGEEFRPLRDALQAFWSDTSALPGMAEVDAAWAACMEDAGYPGFDVQADASGSISEAYNAAWTGADGSPVDHLDEATVAQLSKTEIDTALADLDCRTSTGYADRTRAAQWAAEQAFVDAHRSELDAAKAAAAQARP